MTGPTASPSSSSSTSSSSKMGGSAQENERQPDITREELERLQKAFKNEEFRNLFSDYVKEISDPENKKLYEQEIAALEAERGNDIRWVKPNPWKVIKTKFIRPPEPENVPKTVNKVFVNVCDSPEIETGKATRVKRGGQVGESWSLPYSLCAPRPDTDHANNECIVYDCVFNPEMTAKGTKMPAFADILYQTAVEGVEKQFAGVKLSREWKVLRLKYKGEPKATVIRAKTEDKPKEKTSLEFLEKLQTHMPAPTPASRPSQPPTLATKPMPSPATDQKKGNLIEEISSAPASSATTPLGVPEYTILHRGVLSYQQFTNEREKTQGARPEFLVVKFQLPLVGSAAELEVDTTDREVVLAVPKKYSEIRVALPFPVHQEKAKAKFCKKKRELEIEAPVVAPAPSQVPVSDVPFETEEELKDSPAADDSKEKQQEEELSTPEPTEEEVSKGTLNSTKESVMVEKVVDKMDVEPVVTTSKSPTGILKAQSSKKNLRVRFHDDVMLNDESESAEDSQSLIEEESLKVETSSSSALLSLEDETAEVLEDQERATKKLIEEVEIPTSVASPSPDVAPAEGGSVSEVKERIVDMINTEETDGQEKEKEVDRLSWQEKGKAKRPQLLNPHIYQIF